MNTTQAARINELRTSIARRALATIGTPTNVTILDVHRVGSVFVVVTQEHSTRLAPYAIETFRIPTSDNTDPDYEQPGEAPKRWTALAWWTTDDINNVPNKVIEAQAYATECLAA